MRTSLLLAAALTLLPATASAQARSIVDTLLDLRVGSGRPGGGSTGMTRQQTLRALARGGVTARCSLTWFSDEAGVEQSQCSVSVGTATLTLTFVRYRLPQTSGAEQLSRVTLSSPSDSGFRARTQRSLERRLGAPETHGPDRRWHPPRRWVVLDDPSNQPCGGLCVPTLWLFGEHDAVMERFGF